MPKVTRWENQRSNLGLTVKAVHITTGPPFATIREDKGENKDCASIDIQTGNGNTCHKNSDKIRRVNVKNGNFTLSLSAAFLDFQTKLSRPPVPVLGTALQPGGENGSSQPISSFTSGGYKFPLIKITVPSYKLYP